MIRLVLFLGMALVATLPGIGVAALYLRSKGIAATEGVPRTFMKTAPLWLRAAVITLNLVMFGVIYALVHMLFSGLAG